MMAPPGVIYPQQGIPCPPANRGYPYPGVVQQPRVNPAPVVPAWARAPSPAPAPKIRMQAPEEDSPPRLLALPPPEALGIKPASPKGNPTLDWNVVRDRFHQLGALSFRVDRVANGGYRVTFVLPANTPQRTRMIETTGDTENQAVNLALQQAEQWSGKTR